MPGQRAKTVLSVSRLAYRNPSEAGRGPGGSGWPGTPGALEAAARAPAPPRPGPAGVPAAQHAGTRFHGALKENSTGAAAGRRAGLGGACSARLLGGHAPPPHGPWPPGIRTRGLQGGPDHAPFRGATCAPLVSRNVFPRSAAVRMRAESARVHSRMRRLARTPAPGAAAHAQSRRRGAGLVPLRAVAASSSSPGRFRDTEASSGRTGSGLLCLPLAPVTFRRHQPGRDCGGLPRPRRAPATPSARRAPGANSSRRGEGRPASGERHACRGGAWRLGGGA